MLYVTNTNNVTKALLCVWLGLEQDGEQICLLSFITISQTFVWINHVNINIRSEKDEVSYPSSYA